MTDLEISIKIKDDELTTQFIGAGHEADVISGLVQAIWDFASHKIRDRDLLLELANVVHKDLEERANGFEN